MEKIILKDKTEIIIMEGASLGFIVVQVERFAELEDVAGALMAAGNLDEVQFLTDNIATGEYTEMKLETPLFREVDLVDGKVQAVFSIRKKTEMEIAIEELQKGQDTQDGAIADLGEVVSVIAEGEEI